MTVIDLTHDIRNKLQLLYTVSKESATLFSTIDYLRHFLVDLCTFRTNKNWNEYTNKDEKLQNLQTAL